MEKILEQTKWVIMDKKRKVIARGVPRSRRLTMLDGDRKTRIMTYNSANLAKGGFMNYWFYLDDEVMDYFEREYNLVFKHEYEWEEKNIRPLLKAVKVKITMEIDL